MSLQKHVLNEVVYFRLPSEKTKNDCRYIATILVKCFVKRGDGSVALGCGHESKLGAHGIHPLLSGIPNPKKLTSELIWVG